MILKTYSYTQKSWSEPLESKLDSQNTLVVVFASSNVSKIEQPLSEIRNSFPLATIVGASSSGEIFQNELYDDSLSVAVVQFERTKLRHNICKIISSETSYDDGVNIAKELMVEDDLRGVFILSEGLNVNGSQLTEGLSSIIGKGIPITGGLAGDGDRFEKTWIISNGEPKSDHICAIGFYGEYIHMESSSKGGWDSIGLRRVVTKSKNNILYELDNKPALDIYKKYLGDKASELPASGLLFPLELKASVDATESKIRTILAIDEEENSITFAGDLPEGSSVTFMKANFNRLVNGAGEAAEELDLSTYSGGDILSIAISCVGRRLVLKSKTEEELDAVLDVLPEATKQIGFYSYGEISPLASGKCDLHNQTMTLTLLWENDA